VQKTALAAVAHPDDIEFMMAGTMLLLKERGWDIHFWNLADGYLGTIDYGREEIIRIRAEEAVQSANAAGAVAHPALFGDLGIFYDAPSLAVTASVLRLVRPSLILTHSPSDYMEDHQNVCRLIVTAAFSRGMPNYITTPPLAPWSDPVRIYHSLPHGLRDGLGRVVEPDLFVDISATIQKKKDLLACHESQKNWLDASQGMGAYLEEMEGLCGAMGTMSGQFTHAEAFLRHNHLGFCPPDFDPLPAAISGLSIPNPKS